MYQKVWFHYEKIQFNFYGKKKTHKSQNCQNLPYQFQQHIKSIDISNTNKVVNIRCTKIGLQENILCYLSNSVFINFVL